MSECAFSLGDRVASLNGNYYGVVAERSRHESAGGVRIKYWLWARTKLPDETELPAMVVECLEHEIRLATEEEKVGWLGEWRRMLPKTEDKHAL